MIYLAHTSADPGQILAGGVADDVCELTEGLVAIDTELSRSRLYHRLKALQPADDPLLVSQLSEPPKFKDMAPGSLAWLRDRFR